MNADTSTGRYLTADAILAAQDIPEQDVDTPEWGGRVRVRGLSLAEVLAIRESAGANERQVVIQTLAIGVVEPHLDVAQAEALLSKSGVVCQRVLVTINAMNGMDESGAPAVPAIQRGFHDGAGESADPDAGPGPGADEG